MENQYHVHVLAGEAIPEKWWKSFEGDFKAVFSQIFKITPIIKHISSIESTTENVVYILIGSQNIFNNDYYIDILHQLVQNKQAIFKIETGWSEIIEEPKFIQSFYTYFLDKKKEDIYWGRLIDLVYDISHQLEEKEFKGTVFLAETNHELQSIREKIRRELLRFGYKVLPQQHLPKNLQELTICLKKDLAISDISIHLIGDLNDNIENEFIELQNQIAASCIKEYENLKRLIWFPLDFDLRSEEHRLYLDRFKRNKEFLRNAEIVQIPLEKLKSIIKNYLNKNESLNYLNTDSSFIDLNKKVYFVIDIDDKEEAQEVITGFDNYTCHLLVIDFNQKELNILDQHRAYLVNADAILIFYPDVNEQWLHMKVLDTLKAPGYGRKKPLLSSGILTKLDLNELPTYIKQNESLNVYSMKNNNINDLLVKFLKPLT